MNRGDSSERTPLLSKGNNSSPKVLTVQPENGDVGIHYYEDQVEDIDQQWPTQTHRSDTSSSLMTLAADKKMSDPRRAFCLFVTFDLLITVLLWLIGCGASNLSFITSLKNQVCHLDIHCSMFDTVILACARFAFLVLCYAAFRIRHWGPIAVCTAVCDTLLILKIFALFIKECPNLDIPMTIVLLISDFILTWIEVWFIDYKVLPAETKLAHKTVQALLEQSYQSTRPEQHRFSHHYANMFGQAPPTARSFYSPAGTPAHSVSGYTEAESMYYSVHGFHRTSPLVTGVPLSKEDAAVVQQGKDGFDRLWGLYCNTDLWTVDKSTANGDTVYSSEDPEFGKSFKMVANIEAPPNIVFKDIITKVEEMPQWNKTVQEVKVLKKIGEQTFVTLEVSSPAAMGLIASRQFVTVRRIDKVGDKYVSAGCSTTLCENLVPENNYVRGFNGPTGFVISPSETEPGDSTFVWILNTNLKGNLSQSLVNRNLTSTMIEFVAAMKRRLNI